MTKISTLREQETWLRREGLALIIPARRRLPRVPTGVAAFAAFALVFGAAVDLLLGVFDEVDDTALEDLMLTAAQAWSVLIGIALGLLALPAGVIYQLWQRRRSVGVQRIGAAVVIFIWLILGPTSQIGLLERLALLLIAALAVYWEIPSIVRWAGACVLRSLPLLGPMVAHVLPLLLLAQLLVFFTNEIWQLAYTLDKPKMWALNGLLLVPTVLITASQSAQALRTHLDQESLEVNLLKDTPFEGLPDQGPAQRLRLAERINLLILPTTAQLIQVLLFVGTLCTFFMLLGSVALNSDLIAQWTGKPGVRMVWLGISLPIDLTMFRVSLILATFSGLSFAASNVTDASYRDVFLKPIVDDMERSLAARRVYRGAR